MLSHLSHVWLLDMQPARLCPWILQPRILERVAMPSSRGSSQTRDWTKVSHFAGGFFTIWATREARSQLTVAFWGGCIVWNGEGNGTPLQYSCLENPREGGAWWATVYGVAQSRARLKQLSISSIVWKITTERGSIIHSSTWMSIQCSNSQHIGGTVKKFERIYLINLQSSWADFINRSEAIVNNISMLNAKLNGAFC